MGKLLDEARKNIQKEAEGSKVKELEFALRSLHRANEEVAKAKNRIEKIEALPLEHFMGQSYVTAQCLGDADL